MTAVPQAVPTEAQIEFERQVDALVKTGLPDQVELEEPCFRAMLEPLRDLLPGELPEAGDRIPFVVVVPTMPVVPVLASLHGVGGTGFTTMEPDDLARFTPLPGLDIPRTPYLLVDVD